MTAPSGGSASLSGFTTPSKRRLFPCTTSSISWTALGSVSAIGRTRGRETTTRPGGVIGRVSILLHPNGLRSRETRGELGEAHLEEPVLVARADAFGIHGYGQPEAALERTDLDFHHVEMRLALFPAHRALAGDCEHPLGVLDAEILGVHAGDIHVDDDRVVGLVDVGRWLPLGGGDEPHRTAVGNLVEVDLELFRRVDGERARTSPRRAARR